MIDAFDFLIQRGYPRAHLFGDNQPGGIIGGAVVYAGDQVIDGSLKGRLGKLANSLAG